MWRKFFPWLSIFPQKLAAEISTLFFLGNLKAPGTWGSVAGLLFAYFAMTVLPLFWYLFLSVLLVYFAIGICELGERYFNIKDPGKINLDEFVALPLCFIGIFTCPENFAHLWIWGLAGFALFRFFDIAKPLGIKKAQNLSGGLGCVIDDVLAAFAVCILLNIVKIFC